MLQSGSNEEEKKIRNWMGDRQSCLMEKFVIFFLEDMIASKLVISSV
jgi:hypothetical protein